MCIDGRKMEAFLQESKLIQIYKLTRQQKYIVRPLSNEKTSLSLTWRDYTAPDSSFCVYTLTTKSKILSRGSSHDVLVPKKGNPVRFGKKLFLHVASMSLHKLVVSTCPILFH